VELFDVKYYRDLEMWVRGHSRSLKLISFKSLGAVSYSPSIVAMAVSVAVSIRKIFNVSRITNVIARSTEIFSESL